MRLTSRKAALPEYDLPDIAGLIKAVHGQVDPDKLSVFVPVKNEMAFLPALLAHYRAIGFEQFVVFDDGSDDGTFDYLMAQPDCVVLHMRMRFGERLIYTGPTHKKVRAMRFGTFVKMAVPQYFFPGRFAAYVDADEFLLLPPGVDHINEVLERIDAIGSTGAYASVVEFFPRSTRDFAGPMPQSVEELIAAYGWFEPEPLFDPAAPLDGRGKPVFTAPSKSMRLFEEYKIDLPPVRQTLREKVYLSRREREDQQFSRSARHKTPILKRTEESFMFSCHDAIVPPSGEILLTFAHFVFTANFAQKIENARAWKAHEKGGAKYRYYAALLDAMQGKADGFLSARSQKYEGPQQLIDAGLMRY